MIAIRRLDRLPAGDALAPLLAQSQAEGHGMVERLVREFQDGSNRFDRPGEALYAAHDGGRLAGVCGRNIDPFRGDPRIGRVRHLYVLPAWRRLGVGRALVAMVIGDAAGRFDGLCLRTHKPEADKFYRALGFTPAPGQTETHFLKL